MSAQIKKLTDKIKIWSVDNFVSPEECDQLVEMSEYVGFTDSKIQSNSDGETKIESRNSATSYIPDSELSSYYENRAREIIQHLGELGIGEDGINEVDSFKMEGLQVQKYTKGQKYNPHFDTFAFKDGDEQRNWTVMIYLNEETDENPLEGGCTYFPKIDLRICPKKGTAIAWNNLRDDNCRDENTLHMGEEVLNGEKKIVTMWFKKPSDEKYLCEDPNFFHPDHIQSQVSPVSQISESESEYKSGPKLSELSELSESSESTESTFEYMEYLTPLNVGVILVVLLLIFYIFYNNQNRKITGHNL